MVTLARPTAKLKCHVPIIRPFQFPTETPAWLVPMALSLISAEVLVVLLSLPIGLKGR
jgi:hypothetical protein